LPPEF